jgi:hypothetical protein
VTDVVYDLDKNERVRVVLPYPRMFLVWKFRFGDGGRKGIYYHLLLFDLLLSLSRWGEFRVLNVCLIFIYRPVYTLYFFMCM